LDTFGVAKFYSSAPENFRTQLKPHFEGGIHPYLPLETAASPSPIPSPATEQHPDSAWCAGAAPVRRWRSENQPVQRCGKWFTRTMKIRWMEAILNQLVSIGNYLFSVNKWSYNGKNHLPTGAGFLQSTVSWILWEHNGNVMFNQQPTM